MPPLIAGIELLDRNEKLHVEKEIRVFYESHPDKYRRAPRRI